MNNQRYKKVGRQSWGKDMPDDNFSLTDLLSSVGLGNVSNTIANVQAGAAALPGAIANANDAVVWVKGNYIKLILGFLLIIIVADIISRVIYK